MSYWIEYQMVAFRIPAGLRGTTSERFVVAMEGGSNNLTMSTPGGGEKRVREWYIGLIGIAETVLRQAVRSASDCEDGSLRVRGRRLTPEAYLGRVVGSEKSRTSRASKLAASGTGRPPAGFR